MRFALLEQCSTEAIRGLSVAWLHLGFQAKFLFSFVPSRGPSVDQPQLQVQPRYFRTLMQGLGEFLFGLWHLSEHKIVLPHCLACPWGIGICADESVDASLGKQPAGAAEVVQ